MADLHGAASDSEDISNVLSQLLHGSSASSSSSSCMPFKTATNYMHPLHSSAPPHPTPSSELFISEPPFARSADLSDSDRRLVDGNSSAVLQFSSGFNFSDSGGYFPAEVKECIESDSNTSLKRRRNLSENDLGDFSREDSEKGPEASEVRLNPAPPRNLSKRTRAAEVHNLSEKRRRSRINEKMKALQNLIPNSNKTDKASMLDEAIEYLKQLQIQVQMLTMRNGLSLHPMCFPGAVQPIELPHMGLDFDERSNKTLKSSKEMSPFYGSEKNSMQSAFSISSGCTISNQQMVIPSVANVPTSEALFAFEPPVQANYRNFSIPTSSKELFGDGEPQPKLDCSQTGKNSSSDVDVLSSKRPNV